MSFFDSHAQAPMPGGQNIMQMLQQFRQQLQGDPQQILQQLMSSGRISQQQYEQAAQKAQQLLRMFGK